ncbi:MAG: S8 family peptidase [Bacteroidetes bacterium]|nr:S8 family peptidase [Bacteroidota bacterium]
MKTQIINIIPILFLCLFFHFAIAQTTSSNYWVQFKDKNENPFSLNDPSAYLSQKAIDRRNRQSILISINDLPVNPSYVAELRAIGGISVLNQSKWFNAILVSSSDTNKINTIKALPYVKNIKKIETSELEKSIFKFESERITTQPSQGMGEPMYPSHSRGLERNITSPEFIPTEEGGRLRGVASFNYGSSFKQANQIGADCMHNLGYQGQGMTIAVLDAGFFDVNILPAFDSMRINNQLLGTRDFISGDTMVYEDFPHGMNVLSCMAGNLPGKIIGTAPKAKYWLLRTEDAFSESISEEITWLVGAEFADSVGADIINSSLGYNYFDNSADNHTYSDLDGNTTIITKAADIAASKGILVVSSAGNFGGPPWYKISAPADADSILTVGAVDSAGFIASLSSRGPTFDGRIKPNTVARGLNAVIAANSGDITTSSGTSFSSPITAGAVACLWQANPLVTNMQLLYAIQESSSQFLNPDSIKGYGIPNFCVANTILTGIDKLNFEYDRLNVYPNPFTNNFDITFYSNKKQTIYIELYDISGHEIFRKQENVNNNSYNSFNIKEANTLANGMYLLNISTPGKKYFKKIIKNN